MYPSRRKLTALVAGVLAVGLIAACSAPDSGNSDNSANQQPTGDSATDPAGDDGAADDDSADDGDSIPETPSQPVTLNILDIAGNLQLTQQMIENFQAAHPEIVKNVTFTSAQAPAMTGKLKAEQDAGSVSTSLVLSGTDGLAAGIANDLLVQILPEYEDRFPNLMENYLPAAADMQELADGHGIAIVYYPSGPLLEYNPDAVPNPPTTPEDLLAWAKENPGKFQYADPANSGPGRTWLMGLPYLLGDDDPKDPVDGWSKTWEYLEELGQYAAPYPSGTTETMKNLASGAVDIIVSTTGWDINPRVLGTVPNTVKVTPLDGMHWVSDAQFVIIPKGVSDDVMSANLALISWMLQPDQQAIAYDKGYFYPGPAVKDVTLDMAPQESQDVLAEFGRDEYDTWIDEFPTETSLSADAQVAAFDQWNRLVGSQQ